jgi:hypothetical protein
MAQSTKLPCPHCGSDAASFTVMHWYEHKIRGGFRCSMQCGVCGEAIIASYPLMDQVLAWLNGQNLLPVGLKPTAIWPEARSDVTPDSVPPNTSAASWKSPVGPPACRCTEGVASRSR